MPIPESWPVHVQKRAETFLALLYYYKVSRALSEAAVPFMHRFEAGEQMSGDDRLRGIAFLSYWIASLNVLSEGWLSLGLSDPSVDPLLSEEHVRTLQRYRNATFHFQTNLWDSRFENLATDSDVIRWVLKLGTAYQDFFQPHKMAIQVERIRPWLFARAPKKDTQF